MGTGKEELGISGPGSKRQGQCVSVTIRSVDPGEVGKPNPDDQGENITGSWEGNTCTVKINRAGSHLEGWHTDYTTKVCTPFSGDAPCNNANSFTLFDSPKGAASIGAIAVFSAKSLKLTLNTTNETLTKVNELPGLSNEALEAFPHQNRELLREIQREPLIGRDRSTIINGLIKDKTIGNKIEAFYYEKSLLGSIGSTPGTVQSACANHLHDIDLHIKKVFSTIQAKDHAKARRLAQWCLKKYDYICRVRGEGQSFWAWLIDMVPVATVLPYDGIDNITKDVGISLQSQWHKYSVSLSMLSQPNKDQYDLMKNVKKVPEVKPGLGGGFYSGTLTVEKKDIPGTKGWTAIYPVIIAQAEFGIGIDFGGVNAAEFCTDEEWLMDDFTGPFQMLDFSLGAHKVSYGTNPMFLQGNGKRKELMIDFGSMGYDPNQILLGFDCSVSVAFGLIGGPAASGVEKILLGEQTVYVATASKKQEIHFPFGRVEVTEEGRKLMRIFAAKELALLRSPHTSILFEGHADRVDKKSYNEILSSGRAFGAYQVLKDILGAQLNQNLQMKKIGLGETGAEKAGDPDNKENPHWRRVDVLINGRLVLKMRGEGQLITK